MKDKWAGYLETTLYRTFLLIHLTQSSKNSDNLESICYHDVKFKIISKVLSYTTDYKQILASFLPALVSLSSIGALKNVTLGFVFYK